MWLRQDKQEEQIDRPTAMALRKEKHCHQRLILNLRTSPPSLILSKKKTKRTSFSWELIKEGNTMRGGLACDRARCDFGLCC